MEWVETTAKTVDDAKELALDQLGVTGDEAEFEVIEEPRPGLFGRLRGEARVRARVRPASVRPKQPRRGRDGAPRTGGGGGGGGGDRRRNGREPRVATGNGPTATERPEATTGDAGGSNDSGSGRPSAGAAPAERRAPARERRADTDDRHDGPAPSVDEVAAAARSFMTGLTTAFGFDVTDDVKVEDNEIEVTVNGEHLGLLVGPGGRTLLAIQDLARVAAQRRLGDHETRLRVDVAGYRERRRQALERFAVSVADTVRETGAPRSLDPMPSADRKIVHDVLAGIDGVSSRSEGEEPHRRIVVVPG